LVEALKQQLSNGVLLVAFFLPYKLVKDSAICLS